MVNLPRLARVAASRLAPSWLYILLTWIYANAHPRYPGVLLSRRRPYWVLRWRGQRLSIINWRRFPYYIGGYQARLDDLARKYAHPPAVRVRPGDVVLDVGAHLGEFSLAAARTASRVVAFEPDPTCAEALRRNIAGVSNVELHEQLLWREEGDMDFHLAPDNGDSSAFTPDRRSPLRGSVTLRARTLDQMVETLGLPRVDFLKLDAEGAEPEVLAGARTTLESLTNVAIDCSAERHHQTTTGAVADILRAHRFEVAVNRFPVVFGWKARAEA